MEGDYLPLKFPRNFKYRLTLIVLMKLCDSKTCLINDASDDRSFVLVGRDFCLPRVPRFPVGKVERHCRRCLSGHLRLVFTFVRRGMWKDAGALASRNDPSHSDALERAAGAFKRALFPSGLCNEVFSVT